MFGCFSVEKKAELQRMERRDNRAFECVDCAIQFSAQPSRPSVQKRLCFVCRKIVTYFTEQDPRIFQQAELCRWLLKTDIRMSACFAMDMHQQGAFKEKRYTPSAGSASSGPVGGGGTIKVGDRDDELSMARPPHAMCDEGEAEENAARNNCRHGSNVLDSAPQPPPPGEMSRKFAADVSPECHLLLNATQR